MLAIGGILFVFICVVAGFLIESGKLGVLVQPAEVLIIAGAALGTLLAANPMHVLKQMAGRLAEIWKGTPFSRQRYIDTLKMLFDLLTKSRKEGAIAIESDIEEPKNSPILSRHKAFLADHHALNFVCDTLRMAITGGVAAFDLDQMMELDMDVHQQTIHQPVLALTTVADSLPGLGIVAAVLGVVITMGALGGPPELIGHKVAAALVGTFLGILLCYGMVGPLASNLSKCVEEEHCYYHVLRVVLIAYIKGTSPTMAVEMGRRAIPAHSRPTFSELEKACRQKVVEVKPDNARAK